MDAVDALAASDPDFPWADYDIEDQGDADGDGNLFEPDGVVDHFVIIHAGADKADGGGAEGTYAIWSHAGNVDPSTGGYAVPGTDVRVNNYIMQAEDAGVGVISHEYGHDLGLPDLYDTSGAAESDVDFWDLMSSGSHTGPLFQTIPVHMGLWDKYVLGWVDPETFGVGSSSRDVKVGQTSRTPKGTEDGVRVNLPEKTVTLGTPHSGENMWYSNNDQPWADVKLSRTLDVPAGADVRFWAWNNYTIEELWDYGFIEVSTDGGATWTQLEVRDEAGNVVSTNEDPNGNLVNYGGLQNGLTGTTGGEWRHDWVNLTPYAGTTIGLRLRYATDAAFEEPGWFADDFEVTADGASVWTDDVESGANGWTSEQGTFTDTEGAGWIITSGTFIYQHYYLAEWRNYDGFDKGLRYAYDTTYQNSVTKEWRVTRTPTTPPGMLVWYRDAQYTVNHVTTPIFAPPSTGSKGQLLIVDSHFDPLRRFGEAAEHDPTTLKNLPSRAQSSNAAFAKRSTRPFRECIEDPVDSYTIYCNRHAPSRRAPLHRRQGLVPGAGAARRGPVLPRRRRLGGGPLQGPAALHHPDRRRRREPAHRPVRHRPGRRDHPRHGQPGRRQPARHPGRGPLARRRVHRPPRGRQQPLGGDPVTAADAENALALEPERAEARRDRRASVRPWVRRRWRSLVGQGAGAVARWGPGDGVGEADGPDRLWGSTRSATQASSSSGSGSVPGRGTTTATGTSPWPGPGGAGRPRRPPPGGWPAAPPARPGRPGSRSP